MQSMSFALSQDERRAEFRPLLIIADLLIVAIGLGTLFAAEGTVFPLLNRLLALCLLLLYVPCHFYYRLRIAPELWLFGAFFLWSVVSGVIVAVDQEAYWAYVMMLARFGGASLAIAGFSMAKKSATSSFFVLGVMGLVLAVYARVHGLYSLGLDPDRRIAAGVLPWNPNTLGLINCYAIAGLAYLWGSRIKLAFRLALLPLPVLLALTVVSSASRKSFAGLLAFALLWLAFCYGRRVLRSLPAMMLVTAVLVGLGWLSYYALQETRLGRRYESAARDRGLDDTRTGMYRRAWELFLDYPIAGVGLGGFTRVSGFDTYSHSDYAETLSTTGVVGFILYFSIYAVLWSRIARVRRRTNDRNVKYQMGVCQALLLTMLALAIGVPHFLVFYTWFVLASMIGYTCALARDLPAAGVALPRKIVPMRA